MSEFQFSDLSKCLHPVSVRCSDGVFRSFPCCKCTACLLAKNDRNALLCDMESSISRFSYFGTLTFSPDNLPLMEIVSGSPDGRDYSAFDVESGEFICDFDCSEHDLDYYDSRVRSTLPKYYGYLSKSVLQKFFKRLKINLFRNYGIKFRYFSCGEYGGKTFRPHYHFILFFDGDIQNEDTEHTYEEFPRETWYDKETYFQGKETQKLSVLEYYLRSSWSFGRIDLQPIEKSASSYVSGYVNSSMSLPEVLKTRAIRPFSVHSPFLGYGFLEGKQEKVYETSFEDFMQGSYVINGCTKDIRTSRSYYSAFFPKCRGFSTLNTHERFEIYTIYSKIKTSFGSDVPLTYVAEFIAKSFTEFNFKASSYEDFCIESVLYRMYLNSLDLRLDYSLSEDEFSESFQYDFFLSSPNLTFEKYYSFIYRTLLFSKHFVEFCCYGDTRLFRLRYNQIVSFYDYLDKNNLKSWYEMQELFFDEYPQLCDDVSVCNMFYDATFVTCNENSPIRHLYDRYSSIIENRWLSRRKHRELNENYRLTNDITDF